MNPLAILSFIKGVPSWAYYIVGLVIYTAAVFGAGYEWRADIAERRALEQQLELAAKLEQANREAAQQRMQDEAELAEKAQEIEELRNEIADRECFSALESDRLREHLRSRPDR